MNNDLGTIAKLVPKATLEDCVKEELETVNAIENFSKYCGKLAMQYCRELCN